MLGKTILLVEDEAIIALLHKKKLNKYGFDVITADIGEKAVEIARSDAPIDLVLMDINLGDGIDGTEAAEIILKIRNIPLVFLSSHTEPEVVDKTDGITSYGYIVKNSGETVLAASIKMAFRLFEANEKLRLQAMVLDQIDDRVTVTDLSGNITYVNNAEVVSLGYSREELIGSSIDKYGEKPDSGATQSEILEETLDKGHWRGEVVNYSIDGKEVVMDCRTQVVYDSRGNPFALCGISTDISEKKRSVEEIRRSEEKYRILVQSTNSIILRWKRDGEILFLNDYGLNFFDYGEDELIGKNVVGTIVPEIESEEGVNLSELMDQLFENNELYIRNINQNITRNGRMVWISWTNNVIIDDDGRPAEMFSVGQDITEQKEAEDRAKKYSMELEAANKKLTEIASELKESEEKFRNLAECIPVAIMMYQNDKWVYANPAAEKISGYTLAELLSMNFWDFVSPDFSDKVKAMGSQRQNSGNAEQQYEFKIISKNGTEKKVHLYGTSVLYKGNSAGLISVIDIEGINN